MIRGLNLALAALVVVSIGVGSVFAFTPSIAPVPDVIIGDRTPGNTSAANDLPSDPFTHAQSLEGLNAIADDVYDFPNAYNIFDYVSDEPSTIAGFTSDDLLVYEFTSTPFFPGVGLLPNTLADNRISINGTRVSASAYTTITVSSTGLLSFKDEAMSANADNNATPGSNPALTYLFTNSAGAENVSTGTVTPDGTVTVLDQVTMTVRVTNQNAVSSTDTFFVSTVEEGPDALSGLLVGQQNADLSGWGYGAVNGAGAFGPTYTGDAQATGVEIADNDADGSVSDLQLTTGDTTGDFFHVWTSPAAIIPFTQDGTYHLRWNVSSTIATAAANPTVRFRWEYTNTASLGGGNTVANGTVAAASAGGRDYVTMFDQLANIGSVTGTIATLPNDVENTIRLVFENYDLLNASIGGGQTELNSLEITSINRAALLAANSVERAVTDYTSAGQVAQTGINWASVATTVATTATNFTITSPVAQSPGTVADLFGGATNYSFNQFGLGIVPFAPASTTGRIYRVSASVDSTANSTTGYLPRTSVVAATFDNSNAQLYTTTVDVEAKAQSTNTENPAANGVNTYAAYLALPQGGDLSGSTLSGSTRVAGSVLQFDAGSAEGGSITATSLQVTSFPEALLP